MLYDSLPPPTVITWSLAAQSIFSFGPYSFLSTSCDNYLCAPRVFTQFDLLKPPESYHEACSHPDASIWRGAMNCEMDSLHTHNAFEPADLPCSHKAIGVQWVYAYKYNPDGTIIQGKEKARLVAQGFSQRPEDFDETYTPVAKMTSICVILAFATANDLHIMASDVKTTFLHCCLHCKQVPGYSLSDTTSVLQILVALYGLRQSAFEFYSLLLCCFQSLGMQHCEADHAVFYGSWSWSPHPSVLALASGNPFFAIIPVHVDDGLIICNSLPLYSWILSELGKSLEIVDMGPASLYLGIWITQDRPCRKLWFSHKSYCVELLHT